MGTLIGKGFLLRVIMAVICMLVSGIGSIYVGVGITLLLYIGYLVFMYAEGAQVGEDQCTMTDTVYRIRENGKTPTAEQLRRCFDPKHGIIACAIQVAPFFILALLNLILTDPAGRDEERILQLIRVVTRLCFLPEMFVTHLCTNLVRTDIGGAVQAASSAVGVFAGGTLNLGAISGNATVFTVVTDGYKPLKILNILYVPLSFFAPVAQLIGFLRGPKLRARTLNDMMKGSNRKLRRMRKTRTHAPRQQKPEI